MNTEDTEEKAVSKTAMLPSDNPPLVLLSSKSDVKIGFKVTKKSGNPTLYLLGPNQKGNFVTSFDMDERNGWIVSGQMSGTVNAWKLPSHIATAVTTDIDIDNGSIDASAAASVAAATVSSSSNHTRMNRARSNVTGVNIGKYGTFQCRNLLPFGDGAVRHIIIDSHSNYIVAMIGFNEITQWQSYQSENIYRYNLQPYIDFFNRANSPHLFYSVQSRSFFRIFVRGFRHSVRTAIDAQQRLLDLYPSQFTMFRDEDDDDVAINGNNDGIVVIGGTDVDSREKSQSLSAAADDDDEKAAIESKKNRKTVIHLHPSKYISLATFDNSQQIGNNATVVSSDDDYIVLSYVTKKYINPNNISRGVVVERAIEIVRLLMTENFSSKKFKNKFELQMRYVNHQRFNQSNDTSNQSKTTTTTTIKKTKTRVIEISDTSWGWQIDGDTLAYVVSSASNDMRVFNWQSGDILFNYNRISRGHILSFEIRDGYLVTLSSDLTVGVFANGQTLAVANNIWGTFVPGYPYIVKRGKLKPNLVYYSSDDGLYMIEF